VGELALQIEGMVRVMHPGAGMGVEFTQNTLEQHARVEEFIQALVNTNAAVPELQVRPEGIDNGPEVQVPWQIPAERNDPLLSLFRSNTDLSPEVFQMELRKQRGRAAEPTLAG
jgi:hypothetical protein